MLRSTVGEVMWVGRAAIFLVGLAAILALVLGVASMALGAANGKPFLLGRGNVAAKVSTLKNKGTGAALNLEVQPGQPPLAVNSSTPVTNLNSDLVDGRSASAIVANST